MRTYLGVVLAGVLGLSGCASVGAVNTAPAPVVAGVDGAPAAWAGEVSWAYQGVVGMVATSGAGTVGLVPDGEKFFLAGLSGVECETGKFSAGRQPEIGAWRDGSRVKFWSWDGGRVFWFDEGCRTLGVVGVDGGGFVAGDTGVFVVTDRGVVSLDAPDEVVAVPGFDGVEGARLLGVGADEALVVQSGGVLRVVRRGEVLWEVPAVDGAVWGVGQRGVVWVRDVSEWVVSRIDTGETLLSVEGGVVAPLNDGGVGRAVEGARGGWWATSRWAVSDGRVVEHDLGGVPVVVDDFAYGADGVWDVASGRSGDGEARLVGVDEGADCAVFVDYDVVRCAKRTNVPWR